jgi:porphobilinogen synthase
MSTFPAVRMRRLRRSHGIRRLVRETYVLPQDLIFPLFLIEGEKQRRPIKSLPGQFQVSIDEALRDASLALELGIGGVLLFGVPSEKDPEGRCACKPDGLVQQCIREFKNKIPELPVVSDLCFCEYTSHGHCGILTETPTGTDVDNDETLSLLAEQALSHAEAGVDIIAPSGMMDGCIGHLRHELDHAGYTDVLLLSYAAKFASQFYGPFRDAVGSAPQFGDRKAYQMDPCNGDEAVREVVLDELEGADMVMVKPALAFLDIVYRIRQECNLPLVAYNVSGEYAMLKASAKAGLLDETLGMVEMLSSIKRAGANTIITYSALDYAKLFRSGGLGCTF